MLSYFLANINYVNSLEKQPRRKICVLKKICLSLTQSYFWCHLEIKTTISSHRKHTCRGKGIEMKSSQGPARKKTVELIVVFLCHRALYHCYKEWLDRPIHLEGYL